VPLPPEVAIFRIGKTVSWASGNDDLSAQSQFSKWGLSRLRPFGVTRIHPILGTTSARWPASDTPTSAAKRTTEGQSHYVGLMAICQTFDAVPGFSRQSKSEIAIS